MSDANVETNKPKSSAKVTGLHSPFPEGELPEGVDAETRLFHGIDPDTKERVTVTLEGLKAEFGAAAGEGKYLAIAGVGGGAVFFNPKFEATNFRPPLGISNLKDDHKQAVAAILAAKE